MKLYTGSTYWDKISKKIFNFDELNQDIQTDTLIVGGGMSGNLMAFVLARRGKKVALVEKDRIGYGSSTANTGLLQYSSDIMISELAEDIGEKDAVLFYEMCLKAMDKLTKINKTLNADTEYRLRNSIYYASIEKDRKKLEKEYKYLESYDFPVKLLDRENIKEMYGIDKPCALKTWHDADVNPFKLIQHLVKANVKTGVKYYENTSIDLEQLNSSTAVTSKGYEIRYQNIILATGYTKLYPIIQDKTQINRTYAFATKPLEHSPWKDEVLIWETQDPYLYFRTTKDIRIIAGGSDEEKSELVEDENMIFEKTEKISNNVKNIFPHLNFQVEYRWNALFGNSKDGLPFIGRDPDIFNRYYLLGYEGNGTCYSIAGAEIISDLIENKHNPYSHIVKLNR